MPWPASPPSTFCQLQVTTSSFGQSTSMAKTAEVASQKVRPSRSAEIQSASDRQTPEVVPFQVNITSRLAASVLLRSGRSPYGALMKRVSSSFNCDLISVAQPSPKLSQLKTSTPLAPSMVHMAISNAPVSDAGTMATR